MQVHEEIGLGGMLQGAVRHLLGCFPVTDTVESVGESARQPAMLGRVGRGTGDSPGEEFGRDSGRLGNQRVCGVG